MRGIKMQELKKECEKAYNKKDYSRLDWACNQILKQDKNNETALTYKLYIYCNWRQYHLVFKAAEQIRMLYPDNYHAYNAEAIAYSARKEFVKALKCCEAGLEIKDYYWLRINKIEALISLNRIDEAYEFCNALEIPGYNFTKALINCGKYSEIPKYDCVLSKKELIDYFLKRCEYLDMIGNREEILKVCEEIFKLDKDNEPALIYKVNALAYLGKNDELLKYADYGIKLYPDEAIFYLLKADVVYFDLGDFDKAVKLYEKGFSLYENPREHCSHSDQLIWALYDRADQLIESANFKDAVEIYDKILFYKEGEFKALDNIDTLVNKHNVKYEPSEYYSQSLKLRFELENRFNEIDEYLKAIDVGEYGDEYVNGCCEFKEYNSLAEYIRDIIICLMDVYPEYNEESSKYRVKIAFENVKESFEFGESAYDFAVVYGFSAG